MTARRALLVDTSARGRILTATLTSDDDAAGWRVDSIDASEGDLDKGLPARIAHALRGGVDAIVVTLGPGSYTGVRAGIAAAAGLAAALGIPLHGLGGAELLAGAAPPGSVVVWAGVDAGRGGMYVTRVTLDAPTGRPLRCAQAERVDSAAWTPPDGEQLLVLDALDEPSLERAVAAAASLALDRPPLDLSVTEPITVAHG